jgi:micrococcal nuclease
MYEYRATLVSVYDADTIRFDIDLGFKIWMSNQIVRLYGINAWEVRGDERERGLAAKEATLDQFTEHGNDIILKTIKDNTGKYGRWLGIITWEDGFNLNEWLVAEGHAKTATY